MKNLKRALSFVVALVMILSLLPTNLAAKTEAAGTAKASAEFEPWAHGYRFIDILNWDPATDDYSDELIAKVPLQDRIGAFAATQANPELLDQARLYTIGSGNYRSTDTANGPWNGAMAYDDFGMNLFKFWQYTDIVGAGGRPTEEINSETKNLVGSFEYGTIAVPQAATTNAAHKNGALSLAEYFAPRFPQYTTEWLYKDSEGNYPYAQKLIDIMNYYGFDGYFINQEENINTDYVPLFRDMLKWMRDQGAYIQWYDSIGDSGYVSYQNIFNDYNDGWIWNSENGRVTDSIFLNYWYSSSALKDSKAHAESLGLDPYEVVYMGVEGGQWKFSRDLDSKHNAVDENDQPYTSFAIWGSDWYQDQFDRTDNSRYKPEYQWDVEERERMYFTSAAENAGTYSVGQVTRDDVNAGTINFQGFSKYIVEKSVIDGSAFASNFSTGHGMQYFIDGEVSRDVQWSNLNLQSILPTWQWWMETEGEELTLDMDWDYGPEFSRHQGAFPYTQVGAYNGGNSIVIYGNLDDTHMVNLYKTELDVTANSEISLTYHKTSADDASQIGIAVTFKNGNEAETVVLPIADSGKQTGWTTATVDLGEYAGKVIAAIGVELSTTEAVSDYQINLGYLEVSDGNDYTPAVPTGVKLEKKFDSTNEIQISWDIADYSDVINYHVYAIYADGSERFVGGAYAENYYIQTLENRSSVVALEVRAVGIDGSESAGTQVALNDAGLTNIRALSEDNKLVVTWTGGEAEVELKYFYSDKVAPAAKSGNGTVTFDIDVEDGEDYILTLTTGTGFVNYFGELTDSYCEPYSGQAQMFRVGRYNFTAPPAGDWFKLDLTIDGVTTTYPRFQANSGAIMEDIEIPTTGMVAATFVVTDFYGNISDPSTILFLNGYLADMNASLNPEQFPDPALRTALEEQIGSSLQDLADYVGPLDLSDYGITDLSGLPLLAGVTELDLSGNDMTEITPAVLPPNLTELTLDNCDNLVSVSLDGMNETALVLGDLPALVNLSLNGYGDFPLDLSGCPELQNLYLTGTQMTEIDISTVTKLHNFTIDGSQIASIVAAEASAYTNAYYWNWTGARLDLTEGTDEATLKDGMVAFFSTAELAPEAGKDEVVLVEEEWFNGWSGREQVFDLGEEKVISSIRAITWYPEYYGYMETGKVEVSTDGTNYETAVEFDHGAAEEFIIQIPAGPAVRYIKLVNTTEGESYAYLELRIFGFGVAPTGFAYNEQKPVMIRDDIEALDVTDDSTGYHMLELMDAWYATSKTAVSGTPASELTTVSWADQDYLAEQIAVPTGVQVVITDAEGNPYVHPDDTLGALEEEKLAVEPTTVYTNHQYTGEEGYRLFDGFDTTKWCGNENNNWLIFELDEPKVIGKWYTMHAGSEDAGMISSAFRLQVLDSRVMPEDVYLQLAESGKKGFGRNNSYWKDISVVTGNSENEVTVDVPTESLTTAQVYRFVVNNAAQPTGNAWGALRVYEMELYAYEGTAEFVAGDLFKADTVGEYNVSYVKDGVELTSTTITVSHDIVEGTQDATCTEDGRTGTFCANCGEIIEGEVIPALGHDYETVVTEATCTEGGYTTHTCSRCGDTYHEDFVAALGHSFGEWTLTTEPTCTEKGVETRTCECGETETREVEALGHDYESVVVEPTETEQGYTEHTCKVCGDKYRDNYTDPTGPKVTEPEVTEPEVTEPEVPATSKPAGDNDSADTGDGFSALWICAMTISLMGAATLLVIGKKRLF